MIRAVEASNDASCFNRALNHEMVFVLLARDKSAPVAVRAWANDRVRTGKNNVEDALIQEALACATKMEQQQEEVYTEAHK